MDVTPKDVNEKQFRDAWRGYNQEEVDDFLDRVAEAVDNTQRENEALRGRNIELEQSLSTTREAEEMLKKTLVTAQRAAEEAIAKAKAKADQIVKEAEARARGANEEARKITEEAEAEANRRTLEIERNSKERRRDLDVAIGRLSAYQSELQHKLGAFLEEQKRSLDALTADEPPSASSEQDSGQDSGTGAKPARHTAREPIRETEASRPDDYDNGTSRVVHVDSPEDSSEHELDPEAAPVAHRRGVRGLFFREEG